MALSPVERLDLAALEQADYALYRLWRRTVIDSERMRLIDRLQKEFIHPAIDELQRKACE